MNEDKTSLLETGLHVSPTPSPPRRRWKLRWVWVPALLAGAVWGYIHWSKASTLSHAATVTSESGRGKGPDVTPVVAAALDEGISGSISQG
ncbi:MAG: Multidrug efflux system subunit MdtA [Bryobacterales bacterium]|nr:Multidrug efflux system subunit MdtA [Bryobacterales bacterium]